MIQVHELESHPHQPFRRAFVVGGADKPLDVFRTDGIPKLYEERKTGRQYEHVVAVRATVAPSKAVLVEVDYSPGRAPKKIMVTRSGNPL